jgi:hypothetical protein
MRNAAGEAGSPPHGLLKMTGKLPDPARVEAEKIVEVLNEHLRRLGRARDRAERKAAFDNLAQAVANADAVLLVLTRFLAGDTNAQRIALEIAARLPVPDEQTVERLIPLLELRRFPVSLRLRVAARLLRALPPYSVLSNQILQAVIIRLTKRKAFERLRLLQSQLPDYPALNQLTAELAEGLVMDCPRCGARLDREELVTHLWREHRLLLEGDEVRDPWDLIEEWLGKYARTGRAEFLDRSCELGQRVDPEGGLVHVHRLLLAGGLSDEEARANLRSKAIEEQATLCPHCFAVVPDISEFRPTALSVSRGRIAGRGYAVEVDDRGLANHLSVSAPEQLVYDGPEPGRRWTRRGTVLVKLGPLVLLALLLALALPQRILPPLAPVALLLLIAVLLYIGTRLTMDPTEEPTERAIGHAWDFLAPRLGRPVVNAAEAVFLASLARQSIGVGDPEEREGVLERVGKLTAEAVRYGAAPPEALAWMKRLEAEDAAAQGRDRIAYFANQVGACFAGTLPMRFGEELIASLPVSTIQQGERARLRVLLLARAFEAGLEVLDLQELGRAFPFLGQAYASEDVNGMARLRWLYHIKPQRPWRHAGPASPVLDLARYPSLGGQYLHLRPDLLLFQPMGDDENDPLLGSPILVCEEGVLYGEVLIDDANARIDVRQRSLFQGGGWEMRVGRVTIHFRKDPNPLKRRLQGWMRYLFRDFLPQAERVLVRRAPRLLDRLVREKLVNCPECQRPFLAMRGEVGLPFEESDETRAETSAS